MSSKIRFTAVAISAVVAMLVATAALADIVVNDVVVVDNDRVVTIQQGQSAAVSWYLDSSDNNVSGELNGCNANGSNPATLTPTVGSPITKSTTSATLTGCGSTTSKSITFTAPLSTTPGSYPVTVAVTGGRGGTYNTSVAGFTLRVTAADSTPPVIVPTITGTLGDNGWFVSDVSLTWSVTDAQSTISNSNGCGPTSITTDQAATNYTCSATSAGGTASDTVSLNRDATPPSISGSDIAGGPWHNSGTSYAFTASDALSGLAHPADGSFTLDLSEESANASTPTSASRSVTDNAGNSSTRSASRFIDVTPPDVADEGVTAGTSGTNGWYVSPVTNGFSASDALSGLADSAQASFTVSTGPAEGNAVHVASGPVRDNAGNINPGMNSASFKIDLSDPTDVAFIGGPAAGASSFPAALPAAPTCTADDAVSGLGSCSVSGYSTSVGTHTMTATATDEAGRTATATRTYTVLQPWTFNGFFSPIDMNGIKNTVKGGSTVPIKFELFNGTTRITDPAGITVRMSAPYTCGSGASDAVEVLASGGNTTLRYDATSQQFIQNWKTPTNAARQCINVTASAPGAGNSSITSTFEMK